ASKNTHSTAGHVQQKPIGTVLQSLHNFIRIQHSSFDDIHTMFATPPEAFIYPPQYPNVQLRFDKMKNLLKTGTTQIPELDGDKPVTINLRELLDGFVTPQERRKDEEREKQEGKRGDTYITNNNITMGNMHGSSLTLGDGNTSTVSVQNSFNTFPAELQNTLTELMKASETLLQKAEESEHTEEIKDELESLQTEAKKSKPKKERIKVTVEGLAQAAKNLNEIGKPVLELAMTVIKLINNLPA
ncbi:MAG TPA: hypothetical protein PLN43_12365, partial [Anaerolineales bacterium]|nr:hypothetical protein [Anaerolineales bacterium]